MTCWCDWCAAKVDLMSNLPLSDIVEAGKAIAKTPSVPKYGEKFVETLPATQEEDSTRSPEDLVKAHKAKKIEEYEETRDKLSDTASKMLVPALEQAAQHIPKVDSVPSCFTDCVIEQAVPRACKKIVGLLLDQYLLSLVKGVTFDPQSAARAIVGAPVTPGDTTVVTGYSERTNGDGEGKDDRDERRERDDDGYYGADAYYYYYGGSYDGYYGGPRLSYATTGSHGWPYGGSYRGGSYGGSYGDLADDSSSSEASYTSSSRRARR